MNTRSRVHFSPPVRQRPYNRLPPVKGPPKFRAFDATPRVLQIPELLAMVFERFSTIDSLVSMARVCKMWGDVATSVNWQRCWISLNRLLRVLHEFNFAFNMRLTREGIDLVPGFSFTPEPPVPSDEAKEKFLYYCRRIINIRLTLEVEDKNLTELEAWVPEARPLLPNVRRVEGDYQGAWTNAAPVFFGSAPIGYLELALERLNDSIFLSRQEFKNIRHLKFNRVERGKLITFERFENLHTLVAQGVSKYSGFLQVVSRCRSLRRIDLLSTDDIAPVDPLQFPSLQELSLPAKHLIAWTENLRAFSDSNPAKNADQPTFPTLRSLTLCLDSEPIQIPLDQILPIIRCHAPTLERIDYGKGPCSPDTVKEFEFKWPGHIPGAVSKLQHDELTLHSNSNRERRYRAAIQA